MKTKKIEVFPLAAYRYEPRTRDNVTIRRFRAGKESAVNAHTSLFAALSKAISLMLHYEPNGSKSA